MRRQKPYRILLIEDDPADVKLVSWALGSAPEFELVTASSAGEGIERLGKGADIVLCDLSLPDSDGVETVSRIKEAAQDTPIIVLTGAEDEPAALACIEAGAHDYLAKSEVNPIALRRALSYALERQQQAEIAELQNALERYRGLSSDGIATSTTRNMAGRQPLRERSPDVFVAIQRSYREVLDAYLDHLALHDRKPRLEMEQLVNRLGDLGLGARELVDVHVGALEQAVQGATGERARAYAREGRLLALEMMGHLAEYYRAGVLRSRSLGEDR